MEYRRIILYPNDGVFRDPYEVVAPPKQNYRLHIVLFLLTVLTTTAVGAIMSGSNPFTSISGFLAGLPFSMTILGILGIHEFAHYFSARRWRIHVTLPYFIPAPFLPIGTFGAVIRMKSSLPNRKSLIDVGSSGPIAGFVVALVATYIGLHLSTVVPEAPSESGYAFILGEPLIFKLLSYTVFGSLPETATIELHSVAFAGWIGLFVTALNLIPFGQLDGGHVLFAMSPRIHELFRRLRIPVLVLLGLLTWPGWYVWAVLSLFFGRRHPFPDFMESDVGLGRKIMAGIALVIFILCFTPSPIKVG